MVEEAVTTAFRTARGELRSLLQEETSTGSKIDTRTEARSSTEGPSYRHDAAFFRDGVVESILTDETLRRVVVGTAIHPQAESHVIDNDIRKIMVAPGLQKILLMIFCFGTDSMLRTFETRFLEENCGFSDRDLPFDHSIARDLFGEEDAKEFARFQFQFTALTLGTGIDAEYGPQHILPYVPDKELGRGGFGRVDQVKVERGHFLYREPQSRNRDPVFLARKQFEPDAESFRSFERERRTLRKLANQKTCPSNIVTAICTLVCTLPHSLKLGSIFFPPAICDLDAYIRNNDNLLNNAGRRHIQQMIEVCDAMHWLSENLHHDSTTGKYVERSYIHYDMKPSNILIYEDVSIGNGAVVFKIADFGQTREINRHSEGRARRQNNQSLFSEGHRIYEGTFRAPEIHGQNVHNPQKVEKGDVWSFGCILLLVILFGAQGARAIEEFEEARIRESPSRRDDSFCNPQNGVNSVCNNAVLECMKNLQKYEVSEDIYRNKNVIKQCIGYLRARTLVKDAQRDNTSEVRDKLREIYNHSEPRSATPSSVNHGEFPHGAYRLGHSPDGKIFCFARDIIYRLTPRGGKIPLNPTNYHRPWSRAVTVESSSCSRETLCVVAEWKAWFRCTLFKIGSEYSAPRDVAIKTITTRAVKVVLSLDDRMLAIACEPDVHGHACVRLFNIEDLSPAQTEGNTGSSTRRSSPVINTSLGYLSETHGTLSFVESYHDLRFSANSRFLYCAWEQTGSKFSVQVAIWEISPAQLHMTTQIRPNVIIKDEDLTFRQTFLSTLLPLSTSAGFLSITHRRNIVRHNARGRHSETRRIRFNGEGDLRSILLSSDDQKVVMLATKTRDKKKIDVWGGSLEDLTAGRWSTLRSLALDENISFDELKDDAYLLEEANQLQLSLTSLEQAQSSWIDISELFQ